MGGCDALADSAAVPCHRYLISSLEIGCITFTWVQHSFINVWKSQPYSGEAGKDFDTAALATWGREFHHLATDHLRTPEGG